jgi:hypothetical protein
MFVVHTMILQIQKCIRNSETGTRPLSLNAEPISFTLTILIWEIFYYKCIKKISVVDQNNLVFLYEKGFIQPEMGIL